MVLEVPATTIRQENEIKSIQIGKEEVKLTLYVDDIHRKLSRLPSRNYENNKFGKVAKNKINTQKLTAFLYTNNQVPEREIKEASTFTIAPKRVKYLGINLTKEMKDLYSEL